MRYRLAHRKVIERFGGVNRLARLLGHESGSTVSSWAQNNRIPSRHHPQLLELAQENGVPLAPGDFLEEVRPVEAEAA